ncbi:MAG: peptidoglycan binding domain-containing protein, partial [Patescibacteria group bacterium]
MLPRIVKLTALTAALAPLCLFVALMINNYHAVAYGVTVNGYSIGGKNIAEAKQSLAQNAAYFQYMKTTLALGNETWKATPRDLGVLFDIDATVQKAYRVGKNKNMLGNVIAQVRTAILGTPVAFAVAIEDRELENYLDEHLGDAEQKTKDASFVFNDETGMFEVTKAKNGARINRSMLKYALFQSAARGA